MNPSEIEKEFEDTNIDDSDDETEVNNDSDIEEEIDEDDVEGDEDDVEGDEDDEDAMHEDITDEVKPFQSQSSDDEDEEDEQDEEDEENNYLQKFQSSTKKNVIADYHPDLNVHNETEIQLMSIVLRNEDGIIIDKLHSTVPFITKYEKTRIIGERARQLDAGAIPFVHVEPEIIDGYLIALDEFHKKKIPFIIKRPLPNGSCEYWKLSDLEII